MIASFKDKRTKQFSENERVAAFHGFEAQAKRRLAMLDAATSLKDLAALPGNRLEALKGDREGQHSIRINDQWRICFICNEAERCAEQVEIVDYH